MGCLYSLTFPNGKQYIGITSKTAVVRFAGHKDGAAGKRNSVIYSALRKYKPENVDVKTLVIANDWKYLCELEKKTIVAFGTKYPQGYNMTDGGDGFIGIANHAELISVATKKAMARPEVVAKVNANARARSADPEWRRKISRSKTGKTIGPASTQRKERISVARRLEWADPALRKKRTDARISRAEPHVKFICVGCSTQFTMVPWRAKRNPQYCSHKCYCKHRLVK
jgi:hypothetical protein